MATSELVKESAERKRGLINLGKLVRSVIKALNQVEKLTKSIPRRKKGLPSMADLTRVVSLIQTAIKFVSDMEKAIPLLTDIFKIIG